MTAGSSAPHGMARGHSAREATGSTLPPPDELRQAILKEIPDSIWIVDSDGRFVFVSDSAAAILGMSPEDIIGREWHTIPAMQPLIPRVGGQGDTVRDGNTEIHEMEFDGPTGSRWFQYFLSPIPQFPNLIMATVRDVTQRRQTEETLRNSEARYRTIFESCVEGIIIINESGLIESFNPSAEEMFGYNASEAIGRNVSMLMPPPYNTDHDAFIARYLETGVKKVIGAGRDVMCLRKDGTQFAAGLSVAEVRLDDHVVFVGMIRDITEMKNAEALLQRNAAELELRVGERTEELETMNMALEAEIAVRRKAEIELRASEERYAVAARGANDGLWDWNLQTNQVYYSPRWLEMLGYKEQEYHGRPEDWFNRVHADDVLLLKNELEAHRYTSAHHFQIEYRIQHQDGAYRWMLCRGMAVRDADGKTVRIAGSQTDITERKVAEEQLIHNAFHDRLTGLPNRALLMDKLAQAIARRRRRPDYQFAVLFLDIDHFKHVNDSLGHSVGDQLLVLAADRLQQCLRPQDTIARLGGDEFVIVMDDIRDAEEPVRLVQRLFARLSQVIEIEGHQLFAAASIGIALSSHGYDRAPDMLRDADNAMYRAKAQGRARCVVFDHSMHEKELARLKLESDLRLSISRGELHLNYQPITSLASGRLHGFEVLLRWQHPGRGLVSPAEFIPVAEESGLIVTIGEWVLREACNQMVEWGRAHHLSPPPSISVNLSPRQFMQAGLVETISEILKQSGLPASQLELEITESVLIEAPETAAAILAQLRELGIRIYLDDFGTGYSSLGYLLNYDIDVLKIDRSFVMRMGKTTRNDEIIRTIILMSKNLGLKVVAEGVETMEHLTELKSLQCDFGQGFYLAMPLSPADAADFLGRHGK